MSVCAVVLARDRPEPLARTLDALLHGQTRPPDRVVVVDNAGTDDVRGVIAAAAAAPRRNDVDVVHLAGNVGCSGGFAAGLDRAVADARVEHVVGFDDDATPEAECLERLLDVARERPDAGAVGAVAHDEHGVMSWAMYVDGATEPARTVAELEAVAGVRHAVAVANTGWQGLLMPAAVIRHYGGPWAELFLQFEDVELGLRLRAAGLVFLLAVRARTLHPAPPPTRVVRVLGRPVEITVTSPGKTYLTLRNGLVVWHRHQGARFWLASAPLLLGRIALIVAASPEPTLPLARYVFGRGLLDAVRGRLGPAPPFSSEGTHD